MKSVRKQGIISALALVVLFAGAGLAQATPLTYAFSGSITSVGASPPFGFNLPVGTLLSGRFTYDPASPKTHTVSATADGYLQHIPGGFYVDFGSTHISLDDYLVEVSNRSTGDAFTVGYRSDAALSPQLTGGISIPGTDVKQLSGQFSLRFGGAATVFSSTALPPQGFTLAELPTTIGFFNDTFPGVVDVIYSVDSLVQVPEPTSVTVLFSALFVVGMAWSLRRFKSLRSVSS